MYHGQSVTDAKQMFDDFADFHVSDFFFVDDVFSCELGHAVFFAGSTAVLPVADHVDIAALHQVPQTNDHCHPPRIVFKVAAKERQVAWVYCDERHKRSVLVDVSLRCV